MIETTKPSLSFDMPEYFGRIDVISKGDRETELICLANEGNVHILFPQFLNILNYTEWFFEENRTPLNIPKSNPANKWRYPVVFATYDQMKSSTYSRYSIEAYKNETKLWIILSLSNIIEVISNKDPVITFVQNSNS